MPVPVYDFRFTLHFVQTYEDTPDTVQIDRLTLEESDTDLGACEDGCGSPIVAPYWTCDVAVYEGARVNNRCYSWREIKSSVVYPTLYDARKALA